MAESLLNYDAFMTHINTLVAKEEEKTKENKRTRDQIIVDTGKNIKQYFKVPRDIDDVYVIAYINTIKSKMNNK